MNVAAPGPALLSLLLTSAVAVGCTNDLAAELEKLRAAEPDSGGPGLGLDDAPPAPDDDVPPNPGGATGEGGQTGGSPGGAGGEMTAGAGGTGGEPMGGAGGSCELQGTCSCTPKCDDKQCGDDGCGGPCGSCDEGGVCDASGTCSPGVYEVEKGLQTGTAAPDSLVTGYTGTGYASFKAGEGSWQLTVTARESTHNLVVHYASVSYRALAIAVNGVPQTQHVFQNTGAVNPVWTTDIIPRVSLKAGKNTISFTTVGQSGPDLDRVEFAPSEYSVLQESEAFTTGACASKIAADGGMVVSGCPVNGVNLYAVNVPAAGNATVTFRVAAPTPGANLRLTAANDFNIGEVWLFQSAPDEYRTYSTRTAPLTVGAQTLKVISAGAGSNQNWFTLDR